MTDVRRWLPDVGAGLVVLALGLLEMANRDDLVTGNGLGVVATIMATAVALSRRAPGAALAIIWVLGVFQVAVGVELMLVELAVAVVAFGCARWGSTLTVWLSLLSIPTAAVMAVAYVGLVGLEGLVEVAGFEQVVQDRYRYGDSWQVGAALVGMSLLGVPWLTGLALRYVYRARSSQASQVAAEEEAAEAVRESEQAREIAHLREEQARLARDVHDVVGHSLAVILAQAESAQYVDGADTQKLKATMENIATSARSSLQDVRQVLTPAAATGAARSAALEDLIAGVRASGHEIVSSEVGTPQPLPPDLEVVAFRVLQEMLTNAIKHGQRDEPVFVERHWPDGSWVGELRIEVRNVVGTESPETPPGQGLDGMRRRLEAVGGRLDVRMREATSGQTFTVTAWVPVRTVAP